MQFEIHIEPNRFSLLHIFLMQEGNRVSSASSLVPKPLRELIQSQKNSLSVERDLTDFLDREGSKYEFYLHTEKGVTRARWDGTVSLGGKTELDLVGGRVRIRKVLFDKNSPDKIFQDFARIGEHLALDVESGRILRLSDASGWYTANLLQDSISAPASNSQSPANDSLVYEPEINVEPDMDFSGQTYKSVLKTASELSKKDDLFPIVSEPFEVMLAHFNDRKMSYPKEQRDVYLRDLILKINGTSSSAQESPMTFRVTLARKSGPLMSVKGSCLWDGQWFDFGSDFFAYFEHLQSMRGARLKKRNLKQALVQAAIRILFEKDEKKAEKQIELEIARLSLGDEEAVWESREYLKRFHKTFVMHEVEDILATREGWYLAPMNYQKIGTLFSLVQEEFGGDFLEWLKRQEKEMPASELFGHLRTLHSRLEQNGIQLCFQHRQIQKAKFKMAVNTFQKTGFDWFEVKPEVAWEGQPISESEWRNILENHGILENGENLWLLDSESLKALELMRDLTRRPAKKNDAGAGPEQIPRLHVLDWVQLRQMGVEVRLSEENERWVNKLLKFERIDSKELPKRFRGQLRDYQKEGYEWLAFLYEHHLGGCLADDMGLGKTVQAIAFLGGIREGKFSSLSKKNSKSQHLVVVPSTLVFNWKSEFKNFYPDMNVVEYSSSIKPQELQSAEVVLVTYDLLRRDETYFHRQNYHVIIFDEAQYMKNIMAKRTSSARRLKCNFALTLTGTPLENHLGEYYSVLDISLPGLLGPYEEFRRIGFSDPMERLKKRAAFFVLRRTKEKTLKELPAKSENEVYLRMTPKQKALYQKVVLSVRKKVGEAFEKNAPSQATITALTAILRLRQVCVSPRLVDKKVHERSPKMEYLLSKLKEIVEEEHSVLVFSQFTSFLDVLEEDIKKEGLKYFRMDGKTPKNARKSLVDAFQCGAGAPIFLISLKTGGVGLNLTRASYVFHLDPWWNPAVENQASDRVHRIGQTKNVFVTRLLMEHTVEDKMMLLKKKKAELYLQVLEGILPKSGKPGLLTKQDFDFLLG